MLKVDRYCRLRAEETYMMKIFFMACFVILIVAGCVNVDDPVTELESNCYNWPENEFSSTNHATVSTISQGSQAIDFTLRDPGGESYTLSSLLDTKPVLMVFGSFT